MKKEFRVIVDHYRNGEVGIRDELTVCRWEEAYNGGNTTKFSLFHRENRDFIKLRDLFLWVREELIEV